MAKHTSGNQSYVLSTVAIYILLIWDIIPLNVYQSITELSFSGTFPISSSLREVHVNVCNSVHHSSSRDVHVSLPQLPSSRDVRVKSATATIEVRVSLRQLPPPLIIVSPYTRVCDSVHHKRVNVLASPQRQQSIAQRVTVHCVKKDPDDNVSLCESMMIWNSSN